MPGQVAEFGTHAGLSCFAAALLWLSPSHLQPGEDLAVSAQGAQAPATLCASQTADVIAPDYSGHSRPLV